MLEFAVKSYNTKNEVAVFDEEIEEVAKFKQLKEFLEGVSDTRFIKCPFCKSENIIEGCCDAVAFYGKEDVYRGKIEDIIVTRCDDCGYTNVHIKGD